MVDVKDVVVGELDDDDDGFDDVVVSVAVVVVVDLFGLANSSIELPTLPWLGLNLLTMFALELHILNSFHVMIQSSL